VRGHPQAAGPVIKVLNPNRVKTRLIVICYQLSVIGFGKIEIKN